MPTCQICGKEPSRYVCSNCGRSAGSLCFQKEGWLCKTCAERETDRVQHEGEGSHLTFAQTLLVIAFLMVFAGVILLILSGPTAGQGGFVIVFPFFFASSGSGFILIPAFAIVALIIILTILSLRGSGRK